MTSLQKLSKGLKPKSISKTPAIDIKGIEHHKTAARHHQEAAKHHLEAAGHHEAGNHGKAANSAIIAYGHNSLANEAQKADIRNHATNLAIK